MKEMENLAAMATNYCPCADVHDLFGCICDRAERAVRMYAGGELKGMPAACREECLEQIEQVEGYNREEYEHADDRTLAYGVICAWIDYVRDKGLLS